MNLYAYVLNNPFLYLDPDGEEAISFALSLTALYSAWSTGGLTAAAAAIGVAALPVTLAVATGVAVGWAAYEINKSNPNLARNLLGVHAVASNGMYTPYYTFTPEMAKKAEKEKDRTESKDLREQLALEEAKSGAGKEIPPEKLPVKDPRYPTKDWAKMQHEHVGLDKRKINIHFWQNRDNGERNGFKFKTD